VLPDLIQQKIIDYEIALKPHKPVRTYTVRDGASGGMELEALRELILRRAHDPRIIDYYSDNDTKDQKVIREAGWNISESFDPNHVVKLFDRKLKKYNIGS
jgi:hypothetical protein